MQIELINLQKEVGITFVYVTHDQTEALALSHRIAVMNQRPRRADRRAVADLRLSALALRRRLHRPLQPARRARSTRTRGGVVTVDVDGLGPVRVAAAPPSAPAAGTIALRPEKIRIAPPRAAGDAGQPLSRHRHRAPLHGRRDRVHASTRRAARSIEALLANSQTRPREVLRSRRRGRDGLAGRRRPLHRGMSDGARDASAALRQVAGQRAAARSTCWCSSRCRR